MTLNKGNISIDSRYYNESVSLPTHPLGLTEIKLEMEFERGWRMGIGNVHLFHLLDSIQTIASISHL